MYMLWTKKKKKKFQRECDLSNLCAINYNLLMCLTKYIIEKNKKLKLIKFVCIFMTHNYNNYSDTRFSLTVLQPDRIL